MEFDLDQLRGAFVDPSAVFLDLVRSGDDLGVPTALEGWDCAVLVGHVSTAIEGLWRWQGDRSGGAGDYGRHPRFSTRWRPPYGHCWEHRLDLGWDPVEYLTRTPTPDRLLAHPASQDEPRDSSGW